MFDSQFFAIERARRYLATLPAAVAGQRGHDATFSAACALVHGFSLSEDVAFTLLASGYNPRCCPPWSDTELAHKVRSAVAATSKKPRGYLLDRATHIPSSMPSLPPSKWPTPDAAAIDRITVAGPTALKLWERSPHPLDVDDGSNCNEIVQALFACSTTPDPLLCIGKSSREFATRPLSVWIATGKLPDHSLIVPSPMSALTGRTKDGCESEHTLENTGPRRFVVVEFDKGTPDDHAARLRHLADFAPLAVIVHSGGKSLHGWFPVGDAAPADVERFMRYAAKSGLTRPCSATAASSCACPAARAREGAVKASSISRLPLSDRQPSP